MERAVSLTHARGSFRLLTAGSRPLAGLGLAGACLATVAWLTILLAPQAGDWAWLVVALAGVAPGLMAGSIHDRGERDHPILPAHPRTRALITALMVSAAGLALAAVTVGLVSVTIPTSWEIIASRGPRAGALTSGTEATVQAARAVALAFPFVLAGAAHRLREGLAALLPHAAPTLALALGVAVGLDPDGWGFPLLLAMMLVLVVPGLRLDWGRVARRLEDALPAVQGSHHRSGLPPLARLGADRTRWLLRTGLPALALTLLGWGLCAGVATGDAQPTADTVVGLLTILLIPFPRVLAMTTILGMPPWATGSSDDPRWRAWQLLPLPLAKVEREAILGLLVLGLLFSLADLVGVVAWFTYEPPAHSIVASRGLIPANFDALLAPATAAALHLFHFRRGRRFATAGTVAVLAFAWLLAPVLAVTQVGNLGIIDLLGKDLGWFEGLGEASKAILMLAPTLAWGTAAWLAWLASTRLLWRTP